MINPFFLCSLDKYSSRRHIVKINFTFIQEINTRNSQSRIYIFKGRRTLNSPFIYNWGMSDLQRYPLKLCICENDEEFLVFYSEN